MNLFNALIIAIFVLCLGCTPSSQNKKPKGPSGPTPQQQPTGESPQDSGPPIINGTPIDVEVGDWDSYGSPAFPADPAPEPPFAYICSAFLQDGLKRKGRICKDCEEHEYRLYRLYNFEVDNDNRTANFDGLEYKKIAFFSAYTDMQHQTYEVQEDLQLENPKATLSFSVINDRDFNDRLKKTLKVYSSVGQGFGDKTVYHTETHRLSRDYHASFSTALDVRNTDPENKEPVPELLLEVKCQKQQ